MTKFLITLFSIFSFPHHLLAITLEQVQERYQEMKSFQGNFLQTTIVESEDRRASASGIIAYQRPGKMRWEYQEPDPQLLVTDGDTLWLYDPLLENVTIQELAAVTDGTALAFLLGAGELTEDFTQRRMQKSLLDPDKSCVLTGSQPGTKCNRAFTARCREGNGALEDRSSGKKWFSKNHRI